MRTGTGLRRDGAHMYCDEQGCPADGRAINPDAHEHGTMTGLVPCGGTESTTDLVVRLTAILRAEPDQLPYALGFLSGGRNRPVLEALVRELEMFSDGRVQSRVQRDPVDSDIAQVRMDERGW